MIVTEKVRIKTHTKLKKYYENLGYDMSNEFVDVFVKDLTKSSHINIDVICDICGIETNISYKAYNISYKKDKYYCCSSLCSRNKAKKKCVEKYGKEYYTQTDEYIIENKKICLERNMA